MQLIERSGRFKRSRSTIYIQRRGWRSWKRPQANFHLACSSKLFLREDSWCLADRLTSGTRLFRLSLQLRQHIWLCLLCGILPKFLRSKIGDHKGSHIWLQWYLCWCWHTWFHMQVLSIVKECSKNKSLAGSTYLESVVWKRLPIGVVCS